jgi:hypothetical protein
MRSSPARSREKRNIVSVAAIGIQQQHSLFSQASWDRLEMKPERNKFKVQAH